VSKCKTGKELREALENAVNCPETASFIECVIDKHDCSSRLIAWGSRVAKSNGRPFVA
jgi:TPP-dependent 2-oxoacid decarboxylase